MGPDLFEIASKSLGAKVNVSISSSNDQGYLVEPYRLLPKLFQDTSNSDMLLTGEEYIADGGAALTAYARMQFSEMTDYERKELSSALLKYCELDTLAMVMIYEAWKEIISA